MVLYGLDDSPDSTQAGTAINVYICADVLEAPSSPHVDATPVFEQAPFVTIKNRPKITAVGVFVMCF